MSKIIMAAFDGSANDSISCIIAKTMALRLEGSEYKNNEFYLSDENYELVNIIIGQLDDQTQKLREAYREIERSAHVESYFDNLTIDELFVANSCIREFEMILNAKNCAMSCSFIVSGASVIQIMKQVRMSAAKLRRAIGDLMSVERQLRVASMNKYESSFEMTSDKVTKLKLATEAAITSHS
ncbi:hypothetical protein AB4455_25215 [Vibrio sp. 10N.261.46.E12]|uniref:hypothetical protein n=2 Tax=Vibrio TaxID=662 RepID=UPI000977DB48|nr:MULTISPECIES: hypothetical protein [unclassified Vibrio]OMO36635.1 hypothetical protein BH584_25565 [Vibrio sp. 10N.261.45.E1]PMJ32267.1 hypothetical protein BCU27_25445 [Vibrio sp. 10N.286.45.B6]PML92533.1 hypothetical protein BCT66_25265 [Vibrio sp. 10N.261.49.E11]PMM76704.1 hypothetical protein BCT48_24820 [Vibrio sp. 10N.261.46.F12]PMM89688.1 hypothetical protein BCT46_24480 [Vibrio sp. 10N.261.46.E8]